MVGRRLPRYRYKAQSAMEYLVTYGWAILVVAVVLSVLFTLGVFNGNNVAPNACLASPGYLCKSAAYDHTTGNVIVTLGQDSGNNWLTANIVFVSQSTPFKNGIPAISFTGFPANTILSGSGGLLNGEGQAYLYLPASGAVPVGTQISGTVYAQYSYLYYQQGIPSTRVGYGEIGVLNLKAT